MIFRLVTSWTPYSGHLSSTEQSIHPPVLHKSSIFSSTARRCSLPIFNSPHSCSHLVLVLCDLIDPGGRRGCGNGEKRYHSAQGVRGGEEGGTPLSCSRRNDIYI